MTELEIVKAINQFGHGTFIDSVTIFISKIAFIIILWVICAILAVVLDKKQGKYVFLTVVIAMGLHFIISEGIFKHLLPSIIPSTFRMRPWEISNSGIIPLGKAYIDSSFPSSHMASTLAALIVFMSYYKKTMPAAIFFIILMAFARMHNGMHFPSDVLAGIILGTGYGLLAVYIVKKFILRRQ